MREVKFYIDLTRKTDFFFFFGRGGGGGGGGALFKFNNLKLVATRCGPEILQQCGKKIKTKSRKC